ncbi:MAG: ParB/RepB/Spo0J family partition protein [Bacteroidetes bacterium]|nr:ParB/RepB/Spo0J family partition protein [Bacteroidota bacterium]MCB9042498.1 ParB/RepB/Spo0J family partition protein [Chitinophagales bacterium]
MGDLNETVMDPLLEPPVSPVNSIIEIALDKIELNPFQPRLAFDEEALQDLAASIKTHGVVQPITVRQLTQETYQLISGERRLRAAKIAGLTEVPAFVRTANDQEMLEIALIENIQREDLNAIEISMNYQRLLDECQLTHESLAERLGKPRSTITNYLRLLKLPPEIQLGLKGKRISMGHARAILATDDVSVQLVVYKEILAKDLSVRKVEDLMNALLKSYASETPKSDKKALSGTYKQIQDNLQDKLESRVHLKVRNNGKGEIVIPFQTAEDLSRILQLFDL